MRISDDFSARVIIDLLRQGTKIEFDMANGDELIWKGVSREILVTPHGTSSDEAVTPPSMWSQLVFFPRNLSLLFIICLVLAGIVE